jgi:hypothetical protein
MRPSRLLAVRVDGITGTTSGVFEDRDGWLERTERWRREEAVATGESPSRWVLRPPLGDIFSWASVVAGVGWVWAVASGGPEHLPRAVAVPVAIAHVLIAGAILTELGARLVVRRRGRRPPGPF